VQGFPENQALKKLQTHPRRLRPDLYRADFSDFPDFWFVLMMMASSLDTLMFFFPKHRFR
jgi:hypothetical protein